MARCDNCGTPGFEKECRKCGFKVIPAAVVPPGGLIYCEDCGCHYWEACAKGHPAEHQHKVELKKP